MTGQAMGLELTAHDERQVDGDRSRNHRINRCGHQVTVNYIPHVPQDIQITKKLKR